LRTDDPPGTPVAGPATGRTDEGDGIRYERGMLIIVEARDPSEPGTPTRRSSRSESGWAPGTSPGRPRA